MAKYKIWDKVSDIYTPGKEPDVILPNGTIVKGKAHWSAAEYIAEKAPWAANPNVKIIVGGGAINGTVFLEFDSTVVAYKKYGANITDGMTDTQILAAIEEFEDAPQTADPTAEERIAAALEFQNLLSM